LRSLPTGGEALVELLGVVEVASVVFVEVVEVNLIVVDGVEVMTRDSTLKEMCNKQPK